MKVIDYFGSILHSFPVKLKKKSIKKLIILIWF